MNDLFSVYILHCNVTYISVSGSRHWLHLHHLWYTLAFLCKQEVHSLAALTLFSKPSSFAHQPFKVELKYELK